MFGLSDEYVKRTVSKSISLALKRNKKMLGQLEITLCEMTSLGTNNESTDWNLKGALALKYYTLLPLFYSVFKIKVEQLFNPVYEFVLATAEKMKNKQKTFEPSSKKIKL